MINNRKIFEKKILELRNMRDDWYGEGTQAPDKKIIDFLESEINKEKLYWRNHISLHDISACYNGTIDIILKYHQAEVLINLNKEGKFSFYGDMSDNQREPINGEMSNNLFHDFIGICEKWMTRIMFFVSYEEFKKKRNYDEEDICFVDIKTFEEDYGQYDEYEHEDYIIYLAKADCVSNIERCQVNELPDWATHYVVIPCGR